MTIQENLINPRPPFPNNPGFPLTVFQGAFESQAVRPEDFERLFARNGWTGSWRNGVYSWHHYHSTAHEALGCYGGWALVQFGGPGGIRAKLSAGDAVFIPAGVGHCLLDSGGGFHVVGAYPSGTSPDLCTADSGNYESLRQRSLAVPAPPLMPVTEFA